MYQGLGAATAALDCKTFWQWPPNVLNPTCYAAIWDYRFGDPAAKAAATALFFPEDVYAPVQTPPVPAAPDPSAPVPADFVASAIAQQAEAWRAQNQATMDQTAANLDAAGKANNAPGLSSTVWIAIAVLGAGAVLLAVKR